MYQAKFVKPNNKKYEKCFIWVVFGHSHPPPTPRANYPTMTNFDGG
jgi:hypothetical protein